MAPCNDSKHACGHACIFRPTVRIAFEREFGESEPMRRPGLPNKCFSIGVPKLTRIQSAAFPSEEIAMSHAATHPHRVFDPLLRLLHWVIALSIESLIATSQMADWNAHGPNEKTLWTLHSPRGSTLSAGLLSRLRGCRAGPASARGRDLWHPAVWKDSIR